MRLPLLAYCFVWLPLAGALHASVESSYVRVGGLRLQYVDWGGDGEPLLFIPGGCDTPFVFGDVASRLAGRFRVVGLTARGCGASDRPVSGYGMDRQIADILGFMDALGIQRATLIGHSSGGGKITRFAQRHPGRVRRLVYLDTVFRYVAPGLEEKIDAEIAKAIGGNPMDSPEKWKRSARLWELGAWSPAMDRNFEEIFRVQPDGRLMERHAAPASWRSDVSRDMEAGLYFDTRVAHPALMIFAMDTDRARARQFSAQARRDLAPLIEATEAERRNEIRRFRSNGSHVQVVEMRHAAHYCFVQRPGAISRLITAFLSQPDTPGPRSRHNRSRPTHTKAGISASRPVTNATSRTEMPRSTNTPAE